MHPETALADEDFFPHAQPWDVVYDVFRVTHSEFWLVVGDGPGADIVSAIPEGDSLKGNGEAIGIPTLASAGHVAVAPSVWEEPAPDGHGKLLGTSRIVAPGRELALVNVEGREPGPVLVLPDEGEHQVWVWRRPARGGGGTECYDVRVWP
ncbi:hypothetical protein [Streptomyces sp. NPDC002122]|uniref:hypothetical protein n=1 Tax=Streptomyces sp. NPDC002122 TaxID=3154407 RepID=UPI0033301506